MGKIYKCKYCKRDFIDRYKLTGHVTSVHSTNPHTTWKVQTQERIEREKEYNLHPILCRECSKPLSFGDMRYHKVFCNHNCSALYSNRNRQRTRKPQYCIECGNLIESEKYNYKQKYCSKECDISHKNKNNVTEWISKKQNTEGNPDYRVGRIRRIFILQEQGNKCLICHKDFVWEGKPLGTIMDHIDGNPSNNNRDNLRLVCPNCDSQLPTYKGRNRGKGRYERRQRYQAGKSY